MNYRKPCRYVLMSATILCAMSCLGLTVAAQDNTEKKTAASKVSQKSSHGRDPFKKYQPVIKPPKGVASKLEPPSIQVRIERYRAQKAAAASAHVAAPKPTTALLLNEVQVTGIFHTPRGWSAMVEASPLTPKLSYVIYPGENFFDGQLVAIEEGRLIFRRDIVWTDGRREKSVEVKPLRLPSQVETMNVNASYAYGSTADSEKKFDESVASAPTRQEIEVAIRQAKVLIGMDMKDVSKAWGDRHTNDSLVENDTVIQIWRYSNGEVYFRNGVVYKITLLKS